MQTKEMEYPLPFMPGYLVALVAGFLSLAGCHSSDSPATCLPLSAKSGLADSVQFEYDGDKLTKIIFNLQDNFRPDFDIIAYNTDGTIKTVSSYTIQSADTPGRVVEFTYGANGLPKSATRTGFSSNETIQYTHDDQKRLTQIAYGGTIIRYEYGSDRNVSKVWLSADGYLSGEQLAKEITSYDTNRPFHSDSKALGQILQYIYLYLPSQNNPQEMKVSLAWIKTGLIFGYGAETFTNFNALSPPAVVYYGYSFDQSLPKLMKAQSQGYLTIPWFEFSFSSIRYRCH